MHKVRTSVCPLIVKVCTECGRGVESAHFVNTFHEKIVYSVHMELTKCAHGLGLFTLCTLFHYQTEKYTQSVHPGCQAMLWCTQSQAALY